MTRYDEVDRRIDSLMNLKAQGYSYSALVQVGMKQWKLSERQVKRYLREGARREIENATLSPHERLGGYLSQYNYLYTRALQENNLELARKIKADEIHALETLGKYTKPIGGSHETTLHSTPHPESEELAALLAAFEREGPTSTS